MKLNKTTTIDIPEINLEHFSTYSTKDIMEICMFNDINDIEVDIGNVEGLRYFKARNLLKNPIDLREFVRKFPAEDRQKSSAEGMSFSGSASPGLQQPIERSFLKYMGYQIYTFCKQYNFLKYKAKDINWRYYTNYYYNGMTAFNKNYLPHVDPFSYAANIFLTDSGEHGTSFFKYVDPETKKSYYSTGDVMSSGEEVTDRYVETIKERYGYERADPEHVLNKRGPGLYQCKNGESPWVKFEGDECYQRYYHLPSDFNSMSMYRGNRWHSATFDAENSKTGRYSLVSCIL